MPSSSVVGQGAGVRSKAERKMVVQPFRVGLCHLSTARLLACCRLAASAAGSWRCTRRARCTCG
eukprot:6777045-Lingulodinium_polyedra.AAC.1